MAVQTKIKIIALGTGKILLALIGWVLIMAAYFTIYDQFETNAVPAMLPLKDFSADEWENGYFHAKGSFKNNSASQAGDELVPQVNDITCTKNDRTCSIATADIFNHFMNLDVSSYDVETWNNNQIQFKDDSSICANSIYIVDRAAQTVNLTIRRKEIIPDYAAKSPLHPCENGSSLNKDISLNSGVQVYQQFIHEYELRNGIYFHLLLILLNAVYFAVLWRSARR